MTVYEVIQYLSKFPPHMNLSTNIQWHPYTFSQTINITLPSKLITFSNLPSNIIEHENNHYDKEFFDRESCKYK